MQKIVKEFHQLLSDKKYNSVVITTHQNADPDGFCSAYVLKKALARIFNIDAIIAVDDVNTVTQQIADFFKIAYTNHIDEKPDLAIVVDANNFVILGKIAKYIQNVQTIIVIDHHEILGNDNVIPAALNIIDPKSIATCEIIYRLLHESGYNFEEDEASCLLAGILYDSKRFFYITDNIFSIASKLLSTSIEYTKILQLLSTSSDISEKIARLKAAQRAKIHRFGKWIIVESYVSSYEASACRGLIDLGADVAIVLAERKNEIRLSIRTTPQFHEETKINVGTDLLMPLGSLVDGIGGGHVTAGGLNGRKNGREAVERILNILKSRLSK